MPEYTSLVLFPLVPEGSFLEVCSPSPRVDESLLLTCSRLKIALGLSTANPREYFFIVSRITVPALPLLLQPSQSFGSEVEPSTSSTRATLVVAAKRIDQKHRAAEARPVPGGAERLEHESTAEVLCSLVRLGSGRG